ncbi:outer membrane transport energization protein ExbD [Poseidonocella sedimentorum]|uniref:Outer membrane transport energization protein ExbD n=2 Tax=Poseidonocella sedimentorum TaxID=871652 RepID=A0A1I6E581_9RHOB|nr:outer membrane transport energization protein ExbD [Poseidonocella sedimentorum]
MTSLIDVIFLLLLFFMLSSTFTRYAEIPLTGASGGGAVSGDQVVMFLRLNPEEALLNGRGLSIEETVETLREAEEGTARTLLVTTTEEVTTQRLVDLLIALDTVPDLSTQVLR